MNMLVKSSAVAAAVATSPALANADRFSVAPGSQPQDPVIALANKVMEAWDGLSAAITRKSPLEEAKWAWEKKNPMPQRPALSDFDETLPSIPGLSKNESDMIQILRTPTKTGEEEEEQAHRAVSKWKRRKQAAARRIGYVQAKRAEDEANEKLENLIEQLCQTRACTLAGLAAKARVARRLDGDEYVEHSISEDVSAMAGEATNSRAA